MRAHASVPRLGCAWTLAFALMGTSIACKRGHASPDGPDARAARAELVAGALMAYGEGGGLAGATSHLTVFTDGRVERTTSGRPRPLAHVTTARVEKLASDLAASGVFAEKDGSWTPSRPVPDGMGAGIVLRDSAGAVHAFDWSTGATAPDVVVHAMGVARAFATEVERDNPATPCTCQAGDPLCSCF